MKSSCVMPDLQLALLEAARLDETPEPELSFHLEACEDCQVAFERMRRLTATWMADPVAARDTDAVVTAAAARFETRFEARARQRRVTWHEPVSFVFVGAVAAALVLVVTHKVRSPWTSVASATSSPVESMAAPRIARGPSARDAARGIARAPAALAVPHVEGPRGVTPLVDGLRIELQTGETATVALADGQTSEVRGPCAVEFWSSANEVGGWRLTPVDPATSERLTLADPAAPGAMANPAGAPAAPEAAPSKRARPNPPLAAAPARKEAAPPPLPAEPPAAPAVAVPNASPQIRAAWERALEAQKRDDFAAADAAYGELCLANDPATRDAARLARAQLWIAHGRGIRVRPILEDLSTQGATPLIRQTALESLERQNP